MESLQDCDVCGKELWPDDRAFATASGFLQSENGEGGFCMDENQPFMTVTCSECGEKIQKIIMVL